MEKVGSPPWGAPRPGPGPFLPQEPELTGCGRGLGPLPAPAGLPSHVVCRRPPPSSSSVALLPVQTGYGDQLGRVSGVVLVDCESGAFQFTNARPAGADPFLLLRTISKRDSSRPPVSRRLLVCLPPLPPRPPSAACLPAAALGCPAIADSFRPLGLCKEARGGPAVLNRLVCGMWKWKWKR